jgi:hypothetical protein
LGRDTEVLGEPSILPAPKLFLKEQMMQIELNLFGFRVPLPFLRVKSVGIGGPLVGGMRTKGGSPRFFRFGQQEPSHDQIMQGFDNIANRCDLKKMVGPLGLVR